MAILPTKLRRSVAQMGARASVPMDLWNEHSNLVLLAAESIERLESMLTKQAWALKQIARQHLTAEMDEDDKEDADFEGGLDTVIEIAREALQNTPSEGPSKTKLPASPDAGGGPIL